MNKKNDTVDLAEWIKYSTEEANKFSGKPPQIFDIQGAKALSKYAAGFMNRPVCWCDGICKSYEMKNFDTFDSLIEFFTDKSIKTFLYKLWWLPSTPRYVFLNHNTLEDYTKDKPEIIFGCWTLYYTQF